MFTKSFSHKINRRQTTTWMDKERNNKSCSFVAKIWKKSKRKGKRNQSRSFSPRFHSFCFKNHSFLFKPELELHDPMTIRRRDVPILLPSPRLSLEGNDSALIGSLVKRGST